MDKDSFDSDLVNLFIALCKGSRRLRPHAEKFSRELGYKVFRFEPKFPLKSGGYSSPDLILHSKTLGNALVMEWTRNSNINTDERKQNQLSKYVRMGSDDLRENAGMPATSAKMHSVIVVLEPASCKAYISFLSKQGWTLPVMSFLTDGNKRTLVKQAHHILEPRTEEFFRNHLEFSDIPEGYIPFSLQHIRLSDLVELITNHLISLIIKGETKRVDIDRFCEGYLTGSFNIFKHLGHEKKMDLRNKTVRILQIIAQDEKTSDLISRTGRKSDTWELLDRKDFQSKYSFYHSGLIAIVNKIKDNNPIQGTLFD